MLLLPGWTASLGIYNLLNTHAPAAEFWYVDRLQNEIGTFPDGRRGCARTPAGTPDGAFDSH